MKKLLSIIICGIIIFSCTQHIQAQKNDTQLAFKYYNKKEYKKASTLFLEVYQLTRSRTYLSYYCRCLMETKQYDDLEKMLKKEIKQNPENTNIKIELAYVYKITGKSELSDKLHRKILQKVIPHQQSIKNLANSFLYKREYELSLKVLMKGRKLLKNDKLFHIEIANIAYSQKNYSLMIDEYFEALILDDKKIYTVQSRLQSALRSDIDNSLLPILETKLLEKVETNNGKFEKLLVWLYLQKKDFKSALTYAIKIDRNNNNTSNILNIGKVAHNNKQYKQAKQAFKYIIDKGKEQKQYEIARISYLKSSDEQYYKMPNVKRKEILNEDYLNFKNEFKINKRNFDLFIKYSHFLAFSMNNEIEAQENLNLLAKSSILSSANKALIKMKKADIILLYGDPYESLLLFSQIENKFKNNPIGFSAKFKKAKVSYFQGEIKWAKIQLDVLKASTSKLISNDAMALTQFIVENDTEEDNKALKKLSYADYLIFQNKYKEALDSLNNIIDEYPTDIIIDDIIFRKHDIYVLQASYGEAIKQLELIKKDYSYENLIDKALYKQALLYEEKQQFIQAKENYKLLITKYTNSIFTPQARLNYAKIKEYLVE